ncbi:MAG: DUF861 domain-containing protein [Chlorobi bacterium]|nr:DUF861 domain-containing protein [Chlorobiota bacterium]
MKVIKPTQEQIASTSSWGTWEKEVSEFPWEYSDKETCYILDGEAEVISDKGKKITFKKGDWVEFEEGLKCTWKITKDIKKKYMFG